MFPNPPWQAYSGMELPDDNTALITKKRKVLLLVSVDGKKIPMVFDLVHEPHYDSIRVLPGSHDLEVRVTVVGRPPLEKPSRAGKLDEPPAPSGAVWQRRPRQARDHTPSLPPGLEAPLPPWLRYYSSPQRRRERRGLKSQMSGARLAVMREGTV